MFRNVCVLTLLVLCGHTVTADPIEIIKQVVGQLFSQAVAVVKNCVTHYKITELLANPTPENAVKALSCGLACGSTAIGLLNSEDKIQGGALLALLPEGFPFKKDLTEAVNDCSAKGGSDPCVTVFEFFKCLIHDKAFGHIIKVLKSFLLKLVASVMM